MLRSTKSGAGASRTAVFGGKGGKSQEKEWFDIGLFLVPGGLWVRKCLKLFIILKRQQQKR